MSVGWRVGVFGGTFDPPHIGHSIVAREVVDAVGLDRLLWVPARVPPHKRDRPVTSAAVRRRMVEAAVGDDASFMLCDLELKREGISYTVDTLRSLRASHPAWSLFLVLGPDLVAGFASWKEPDVIGQLAELVAVAPAGRPPPPAEAVGARIVGVTPVDISSSRIRSGVVRGEAVSDMVLPGVLSIIEDQRLYRPVRNSAEEPGRTGKPEEADAFR